MNSYDLGRAAGADVTIDIEEPAAHEARDARIRRVRAHLLAIRSELAVLKCYAAADAMAHSVGVLDRSRSGGGDDRSNRG